MSLSRWLRKLLLLGNPVYTVENVNKRTTVYTDGSAYRKEPTGKHATMGYYSGPLKHTLGPN